MADTERVLCSPCQSKDESNPAAKYCVICDEALCKACVSCHKTFKQTKSHNLIDCSSRASSSYKAAQLLSSYLICPDHEERTIEVLCEDHNVLCCLTCFTLSHNTCQKYREIKKTAAGFKENGQSDQFRARLEKLSSIMQEIIDTNKLRRKDFDKYKAKITEQLEQIKNQLMSIYERIESDVMAKVEGLRRDDDVASRSLEEKWIKKFDINAEQLNLLDFVMEIGTDAQVFVTVHKLKENTGETERALEDQGSQIVVQRPILKKRDKLESFLQANTNSLVDVESKDVQYKLPLTSSYTERARTVALDEEITVTSDVFDSTETKGAIKTNDKTALSTEVKFIRRGMKEYIRGKRHIPALVNLGRKPMAFELETKYVPFGTCARPNGGERCLIKRDQPPGKMEVNVTRWYISITYTFNSGIQGPDHPNPGRPYKGITIEAYLPANEKGRELCDMLKVAFDRKLLFTISPSNVIECTIHHITNRDLPIHHEKLQIMEQELAAKGITSDDILGSYRTK